MMKPTRPFKSKSSPYPREFRAEAVRYWLSSSQSLKMVASDLGISPEGLRS
jgi:transposase-like protein